MKLRRASKPDAKIISEISRVAFERAFRNEANAAEVDAYLAELDEAYMLKWMEDPHCRFWVVEDEEGLYGFAQLIRKSPPEDEGKTWLKMERLYLSPDRIGTGAGHALMEVFIDVAKEDAVDYAWLEVLNTNSRAVRFYERHGLETFDTCSGKFKADDAYDLRMRRRP